MAESLYQLRVYTLDSEASADAYEEVWRRHLTSLPLWKVHVYGMWRPVEKRNTLTVLTGMPGPAETEKLASEYMHSKEFLSDFDHLPDGFEGFKGKIQNVEATTMSAIAGSPMR